MLLTRVAGLDQVLEQHASDLGADFEAYRNHCYRVLNFCRALGVDDVGTDGYDKLAIAVAFHDLGIWTDHTFDYLPPSERLARDCLARTGASAWEPEVLGMIREISNAFPNAGFHRRLVQLALHRWLRHPLDPLPMVRL